MGKRVLGAALLVCSMALHVPSALATDPFVYRACLAQCKSFPDPTCCHEACSYNACIAHNIKTNLAAGDIRLSQVDPGAWSGAMAACYSWITILQSCGGGTPGTPETASGTEVAPSRPLGLPTGAHLRLVSVSTEPADLDKLDQNVWKRVVARPELGKTASAVYDLQGSTAEYTWSVPAYLDDTPRSATVSASSKAVKNAYGHPTRLAYAVSMGGDAKFEGTAPSLTGVSESTGGKAEGQAAVNVRAPSMTPTSTATIKISVNYAFSVTYHYSYTATPPR